MEMKATSASLIDKREDQALDVVPMTSTLPISCIQKTRRNVSDPSSEVLETADLFKEVNFKLPARTIFDYVSFKILE